MSANLPRIDSATVRHLAVGGAVAALLGCWAGADLRMAPAERFAAAAPQQIHADAVSLAALERTGRGWPARRHS